MRTTTRLLFCAAALPLALTACTEKEAATSAEGGDIVVDATDSSCDVGTTSAQTGSSTFQVTNNGSKVTEFYVYGEGDRVMGEIENIGPGVSRQLIVALPEPATYQTACKPGMVGDGLRGDFVVTGDAKESDADGTLAEAADGYKRYVVSQVTALQETTASFVTAVTSGDVEGAKAQFPLVRTYYERIEPVAESFPDDLDPRIDLREPDVEPGAEWTGFHRLEKDLWAQGLQPDTNAIAEQLKADVDELVAGVQSPDFVIDPITVAGGAQGLLDEVAQTKITGEEDFFSHTDLYDFQANVDGSQAAVAALAPVLSERNPELAATIEQRFAELDTELAKYRQGDGFVSYDTVTEPQRQDLSKKIDALSASVSQVQGVVAGA
ncbi:cupredoxin domain-containing protein [Rhodococcus sp. BP-349]|uniref:iron uptake system protein EfeO n=1 Tax=unclassified Rhodococcus (in: high G+C Gram-positive bacteria) TaxID=192944 RepID=UPI001C9A6A57|nr:MULTISPECIES: iron uptake system protein EfeO [unclassified Rhodococcus (in: high G+C Gram-positive bacteria)]MBY6538412.1 cupredoxin domain-containing protein [Rhodococcus sp. BP-363]MBY6542749.1 cupredoxin domain-containing protein [Rhodococcus sp. BP-369]MBY6561979.1 cupredoxin domain-containing protein [Rhodococcus sp. BP-370]MBY6576271.1 cupredoxin domain-containing protein [Rhodococcus sp. BP-364]MBY6585572.1 cupredoxin domain-containing protein [Rhodococcus sp. BP-358]